MLIDLIKDVPISIFEDDRGELGVCEIYDFQVKRIYYITKVNSNFHRGGHAHKNLRQIFCCIKGTFDFHIDSGFERVTIKMNSRSGAKLIEGGLWRDLGNFSKDAVCLVLASEHYDPEDYIYSYSDFIQWKSMK